MTINLKTYPFRSSRANTEHGPDLCEAEPKHVVQQHRLAAVVPETRESVHDLPSRCELLYRGWYRNLGKLVALADFHAASARPSPAIHLRKTDAGGHV